MQKPKLSSPLNTGDKVTIIDTTGLPAMATVLSCKIQEKKEKCSYRWNITVWLPHTKKLQTVSIGSYSSMISEYAPDLDV
jgi:hypothetical protein